MYRIQTLNKISSVGLNLFDRELYEVASEISQPDGILVRSQSMHEFKFNENLAAIARAGAGVNNIPVETCTERGIVVFNTPGANANSVKELVFAGMLLSSRKLVEGIVWARSLAGKGPEVPQLVEKNKSQFAGPEIQGKKMGVVGLGAIGVMVANDAEKMGMEVVGYDPFISVEAAWGLSPNVRRAISLDSLLAECDYISFHIPFNDKTRGLIHSEKLGLMKKGVRLLNFSRGGIVNNKDLMRAIEQGIVGCYVTDFPDDELVSCPQVLPIPHLGASTPEAENNCAKMAVNQIRQYLEEGNIVNSVNFPTCVLPKTELTRITVSNKNVPNMVGQIATLLAEGNINIFDMINKSRGDVAYNIIDTSSDVSEEILEKIKKTEGVITVRKF